jgi:hypothetical protein
MKMASDADEFKEELQRLANVTKIRNDERIQASERALQLFGPIKSFLLRFNEALGEFGKIEWPAAIPSANINMQRRPLQPPMAEW